MISIRLLLNVGSASFNSSAFLNHREKYVHRNEYHTLRHLLRYLVFNFERVLDLKTTSSRHSPSIIVSRIAFNRPSPHPPLPRSPSIRRLLPPAPKMPHNIAVNFHFLEYVTNNLDYRRNNLVIIIMFFFFNFDRFVTFFKSKVFFYNYTY